MDISSITKLNKIIELNINEINLKNYDFIYIEDFGLVCVPNIMYKEIMENQAENHLVKYIEDRMYKDAILESMYVTQIIDKVARTIPLFMKIDHSEIPLHMKIEHIYAIDSNSVVFKMDGVHSCK